LGGEVFGRRGLGGRVGGRGLRLTVRRGVGCVVGVAGGGVLGGRGCVKLASQEGSGGGVWGEWLSVVIGGDRAWGGGWSGLGGGGGGPEGVALGSGQILRAGEVESAADWSWRVGRGDG